MNTLIEQVLSLPEDEKIELYYALQEDLHFEESGLTDEQWKQLDGISTQIDNGTIEKISKEEMMQFLKKRRGNVSAKL